MRSASTGSEHSQEKGQAIHRFFPTWTFPFSPVWIRVLFKIRTRDEIGFAFVTTFLSRAPPRVCVILPLRQKDESRGNGEGEHGGPAAAVVSMEKEVQASFLHRQILRESKRFADKTSEALPKCLVPALSVSGFACFRILKLGVGLLGSRLERPSRKQ